MKYGLIIRNTCDHGFEKFEVFEIEETNGIALDRSQRWGITASDYLRFDESIEESIQRFLMYKDYFCSLEVQKIEDLNGRDSLIYFTNGDVHEGVSVDIDGKLKRVTLLYVAKVTYIGMIFEKGHLLFPTC